VVDPYMYRDSVFLSSTQGHGQIAKTQIKGPSRTLQIRICYFAVYWCNTQQNRKPWVDGSCFSGYKT